MIVGSHDRGEATVELAVLAPVLFSMVFAVVHVGSFWLSAQTASAAATRGARAASMAGNGREVFERGARTVEQTVTELGAELASAPFIVGVGRNVRASVEVRVATVVPFLPRSVTRTRELPIESFVPEYDR